MSSHKPHWGGQVMTLGGLIPAEHLGITLPHEHLIVQGWDHQERNYHNSDYMELAKFGQEGGRPSWVQQHRRASDRGSSTGADRAGVVS
jgi:predicted metal-dependent phosphotriesterase family hydrolase